PMMFSLVLCRSEIFPARGDSASRASVVSDQRRCGDDPNICQGGKGMRANFGPSIRPIFEFPRPGCPVLSQEQSQRGSDRICYAKRPLPRFGSKPLSEQRMTSLTDEFRKSWQGLSRPSLLFSVGFSATCLALSTAARWTLSTLRPDVFFTPYFPAVFFATAIC